MSRQEIPLIIKAKTASTYTVTNGDWGAIITNRGGGALTVTLPAPSAVTPGVYVTFHQVAAGDFVITTTAGEEMVLLNNATADSLTLGTDNEEIGNSIRCTNDGTGWLTALSLSAEAVTTTVTDA